MNPKFVDETSLSSVMRTSFIKKKKISTNIIQKITKWMSIGVDRLENAFEKPHY
jgi:hypothetical protein